LSSSSICPFSIAFGTFDRGRAGLVSNGALVFIVFIVFFHRTKPLLAAMLQGLLQPILLDRDLPDEHDGIVLKAPQR
jgi:hypothetical protein